MQCREADANQVGQTERRQHQDVAAERMGAEEGGDDELIAAFAQSQQETGPDQIATGPDRPGPLALSEIWAWATAACGERADDLPGNDRPGVGPG